MKVIRILLKTLVWLVAIVIVALLALPLWFGPVAKTAANAIAPEIVKTGFHLGHIHLNPYTARFELGDLQLSNPAGYSEKYAATLGELTFDAATLSLATDVIHVEEITVRDVFVSVVSGGANNVGNFTQIQYNVAGGKEKYEAAEAEKAEKARLEELQAKETAQEKREPEQQVAEEEEKGPSKKVIIDRIRISGLKVKLGIIPISIPFTVELTDIGKDSGGATWNEAWAQVWSGVMRSAGSVGGQAKALGNATGEAAESVGKATVQAAESVGKATTRATKAVNKAAENATKALDAINNLW